MLCQPSRHAFQHHRVDFALTLSFRRRSLQTGGCAAFYSFLRASRKRLRNAPSSAEAGAESKTISSIPQQRSPPSAARSRARSRGTRASAENPITPSCPSSSAALSTKHYRAVVRGMRISERSLELCTKSSHHAALHPHPRLRDAAPRRIIIHRRARAGSTSTTNQFHDIPE